MNSRLICLAAAFFLSLCPAVPALAQGADEAVDDGDTGSPARSEAEASREAALEAAAEYETSEEAQALEAEAKAAARESGVHLEPASEDEAPAPGATPTSPAGHLTWNPSVDLPLILGTGAIFGASYLGGHRQPAIDDATYVGDPPGGLDSLGVLELHEGPKKASDIVLYSGLALGLGFNIWAGLDGPEPAAQTIVYVEALTITGVITEVTKWAYRRPRPFVHGARTRGEPLPGDGVEVDTDLSFFSGHSSFSATIAFATARSLDLTHDLGTGAKVALYGAATFFAGSVAALRVAAGKHWPSDVLTGVLVGGSVGWLVPTLHHVMPAGVTLAPTGDGGALLAYGGQW